MGNLCPPGFKYFSQPRSNGKGGGVAVYKSNLKIKKLSKTSYSSFEHLQILVQSPDTTGLSLTAVYRPPPNKKNGLTVHQFLEEISNFLDEWILDKNRLLLVGDFNFHVNNQNDPAATSFLKLMDSYGLVQHVKSSTHNKGHTLDLLLTRVGDSLLSNIRTVDTQLSDHNWILADLLIVGN